MRLNKYRRWLSIFLLLVAIGLSYSSLATQPAYSQDTECSGIRAITWHPSNNQFAIGGCFGLKMYDGDLNEILHIPDYDTYHLAWHPSENILAVATDTSIIILDLENPEHQTSLEGAYFAEWSPAGDLLILAKQNRSELHLYDWAQQTELPDSITLEFRLWDGSWNEDGNAFSYSEGDNTVYLWDIEAGQVEVFNSSVLFMIFNPISEMWLDDSRQILFIHSAFDTSGIGIWDFRNEVYQDLEHFDGDGIARFTGTGLSHDQKYLAYVPRDIITVYELDTLHIVAQSELDEVEILAEAPYVDCESYDGSKAYDDVVRWYPDDDKLLLIDPCFMRVVTVDLPK